jgi:hypothetical protein
MHADDNDIVLVGLYSLPVPGGEVDLVVKVTRAGRAAFLSSGVEDIIAHAGAVAREQVSKLGPKGGERFSYTCTGSTSDRAERLRE